MNRILEPRLARRAGLAMALALTLIILSCKPLTSAQVDAARVSEESICKAVVDCYRTQDMASFAQLAMSPTQIKDMMSKMSIPDNARRETIKSKHGFVEQMQDSLQTVLRMADVNWADAKLERFAPIRKPIEMAPGYKYCVGQLRVIVGDKKLVQPFTLVQTGDNKFFVGDFGPFEAGK